ncbi:MAG: hypothetical protein LQ343_005645 [Gyalolechia ehrenbergii]|nr:MAG: hypothetical protein LQ343_005645 [Gyalolechia ehrenbergii]
MSERYWEVTEHVIPASHIRGFSRGVKDESTAHLRLAVKQYVPRTQKENSAQAMTIIMAHGVGSSKESYEPFFDELLHCDLPIRAVWAMDVAHHGASYLMNEDIIGDEPHWFDSSRDMFQMINVFQERMPPPIVGIGQSWGAITVSMLAVWHPRLFSAIVPIEPMFGEDYHSSLPEDHKSKMQARRTASLLVNRRDTWPSREVARDHLLANPYYRSFDPRVFDRVMKYDLRNLPSDDQISRAVTLTTPKTMETYTILRADPPLSGFPEAPDHKTKAVRDTIVPGFYHGEKSQHLESLQYLLPSVLYVWGTLSGYANTEYSRDIFRRTGTGLGGNGGVVSGKVTETLVEGVHHAIPLERPAAAAKAIAPWLKQQIITWEEEAERRKNEAPFANEKFHPEWMERTAKLSLKSKI